jgi:hypothetical protein
MLRTAYLLLLLSIATGVLAQKKEEVFDSRFKPTTASGRYYVVTEKKGDVWERIGWYWPEKSQAMEGTYKDEACKIPHGVIRWFQTNRKLLTEEHYVNGQIDGVRLRFDEDGNLRDSANFLNGRRKGASVGWYANGMTSDSTQFDGSGNGTEFRWYEDGTPALTGRWIADTIKVDRWQHFDRKGKVMANEEYKDGKRVFAECFDENGILLDTALCFEQQASFKGGTSEWTRYLQRNLDAAVPVRNKAPLGRYTVIVQFVINTDGKPEEIKAISNHGFGMEEEAIRMIKRSPNWIPAQQFGRKVKAYRKQPITFVVQNG